MFAESVRPRSQQHPHTSSRVFISYKRDAEPDDALSLTIAKALEARGHEVFIDKRMPLGTHWAERIEQELRRSECLVILLSESSVHSEMVRAELETARRLAADAGTSGPRILPIRVRHQAQLPYPLSGYLDGIQWMQWNDPEDTQALIDGIGHALDGDQELLPLSGPISNAERLSSMLPSAASAPLRLERPEGAVSPCSRFYIHRNSDREALGALDQGGTTLTIRGPRQMGKTALLNHLNLVAHEKHQHTAVVDFKMFSPQVLNDPAQLFPQFCAWIADELDLDAELDPRWERLPRAQACTKFMQRKVLQQLDGPLLLAADDVERLFESPASSEFFGMLRSWHEARDHKPAFRQLDLVLVTSTDPENFIEDVEGRGSPFNVGSTIRLRDFTPQETDEVIARHAVTLDGEQRRRLHELFCGHPYLTRRALYLIATKQWNLSRTTATTEIASMNSPFSDHLKHYLLQLQAHPRLAKELKHAIAGQACSSPLIFAQLEGAGLLRGNARQPSARCGLYEAFFRSVL